MEVKTMRATQHNGRVGKHGVYLAKHNDRNFDVDNATHIDTDRSNGNRYWQWDKTANSFEEAEKRFYEQHFAAGLAQRNENYIRQRHVKRCKTMDNYRKNPKSCPEETIMQVGKMGDTIDSDLLWQIAVEQINWEQKQYPNCKLLDVALHVDEQGAPHIHMRKVWIGHDSQGNEIVGQGAALREMGIEAPHPDQKISRLNNPKQTYTRACRDHLLTICQKHGLDIETEPLEASQTGLTLIEYQSRQEAARLHALQAQLAEVQQSIKQAIQQAKMDKQELKTISKQIKTAQKALATTLELKAKAAEVQTVKTLFSKDIVTYDRELWEALTDIGNLASQELSKAHKLQQEVAETKAEAKRYLRRSQEAEQEATQKLNAVNQHIMQEAQKVAQSIINYAKSHTMADGRTVWDAYQQDQEQLHHSSVKMR